MDINKIRKKLEEKKDYIKKEFHIVEMGIFGSFIRGDQTSSSDIDILVVFEKGHKNFFNYMRLKYYLEELLGLQVDLIIKEAIKPRLRKDKKLEFNLLKQ